MGLSPEELQTFKDAYKEAFGENLNDAKAADLAYRLEELYRLILTKPDAFSPDAATGSSEACSQDGRNA